MSFTRVVDLIDRVEAFQLNQFAAALEGDAGAGKPISLTALNDSAAYALRVANQDTTNGRAFKVFKPNLTDAWIDTTKTGLQLDGIQILNQTSGPGAPGSGLTALYSKTAGGLFFHPNGGAETEIIDNSRTQTVGGAKTFSSSVLLASGTELLPGLAFSGSQGTRNGLRYVSADYWALVANGLDVLRFSKGSDGISPDFGPRVGLGNVDEPGVTDRPENLFHMHWSGSTMNNGIVGITSSITNDATTGYNVVTGAPSGIPDFSGVSSIVTQTANAATGAMRALEAHAIRACAASVGSTAMGMELGIHTGTTGLWTTAATSLNGVFPKTIGIWMASYQDSLMSSLGVSAVSADVGLHISGDPGFKWPIAYRDAAGTVRFTVNANGNTRIGTNNNAGEVGLGFWGDENTGLFTGGADAFCGATGGTEAWRLDPSGHNIAGGLRSVSHGPSDTSPFLYLAGSKSGGRPTSTPTDYGTTYSVYPLYYEQVSGTLFGYNGTAWSSVAGTQDSARNRLINGGFRIWQRGTTGFVTDNAYGPDRWRVLAETTTTGVTVARETSDVPSGGSRAAAKLTIGASNNTKAGLFTILEGGDIWDLRSGTASLQLKMKVSDARIGDVRAAVVQWTGTEDNGGSAFADPINAWGAAATVPTYTGSWANANTPANLSPTTSWATYRIENIAISASATNIAVFVWIDDKTTTAGDYLLVTDIQLDRGSVCTAFDRRHTDAELSLCQRYYQKSFPQATAPAQNSGTTAGALSTRVMIAGTSGVATVAQRHLVAMRAAPTMTSYNPVAANANWHNATAGSDASGTNGFAQIGEHGFEAWTLQTAAELATNLLYVHYTADAEL